MEGKGREGRGGDETRPHPFMPPIHISGYAPAVTEVIKIFCDLDLSKECSETIFVAGNNDDPKYTGTKKNIRRHMQEKWAMRNVTDGLCWNEQKRCKL